MWRICLAVLVTAGTAITGASPAQAGGAVDAAALQTARAALAQRLVPHTAVGIDTASGRVRLIIADAAKGTSDLEATAQQFGPVVSVQHIPGGLSTMAGHYRGGNGIIDVNGGAICTLGFVVTGGKALTAGHCTQIVGAWNKENNGEFIGPSIASNFPGDDFGLIRNDGMMSQRDDVQAYDAGIQEITTAANSFVGQAVCKSGRTTGRTCGTVIEKGYTAAYPQGTVSGLDRTTVCVQPGDSGGPLYAGTTALGITSGGTLGLACNDPSYFSLFQPVVEALNAYGVSVF